MYASALNIIRNESRHTNGEYIYTLTYSLSLTRCVHSEKKVNLMNTNRIDLGTACKTLYTLVSHSLRVRYRSFDFHIQFRRIFGEG